MTPDYRAEFVRYMVQYKWVVIVIALFMAYIEPLPIAIIWVLCALIIKELWR